MHSIKRFQQNYIQASLLILFVMLFSDISQTATAQTPIRIPIGQQIKNVEHKYLSEFVDELKYIPLETSLECLLGQDISKIEIFDEKIFVSDYKHIYIFDMKGKFLFKVAKQGKGPGEYQSKGFQDFLINRDDKNIVIFDLFTKRLITYGFDGSFLFEKKISFMPGPSEWISKNTFTVFNMGYTYEELPWTDIYFLDLQGKTVNKNQFKYEKDKKYGFTVFPALFYTFEGKTRYKNPYQELIYEIGSNYSLSPVYYLDYGVYKSKSELDEFKININAKKEVTVHTNPQSSEKIGVTRLAETKDYLHICYVHKDEKQYGVYDKKMQKFYRVFDEKFESYGFSDDMLGGIPFVPKSITSDYLVSYVQAYSLIESLQKNDKNTKLKDILSKIKEGDNPVLIIASLKVSIR